MIKRILSLFLLFILTACSCNVNDNLLYDSSINSFIDKYVFNNLRVLCLHERENGVSKYSHVSIDAIDIYTTDIIDNSCSSSYIINVSAFKYISCQFGDDKEKNKNYRNFSNEYDKSDNPFCLRFPDLNNINDFPTTIHIKFYIDVPIFIYWKIQPVIWAPFLSDAPVFSSLKIIQEYYLWENWNPNASDINFASQSKENWEDDHYYFQNEYSDAIAFYNDTPSDETYCIDESFFELII